VWRITEQLVEELSLRDTLFLKQYLIAHLHHLPHCKSRIKFKSQTQKKKKKRKEKNNINEKLHMQSLPLTKAFAAIGLIRDLVDMELERKTRDSSINRP